MRRYLANRTFLIGFLLAVFGWGPLLSVMLLSALHLLADPDPNPVGAGILFFFTSWPALICMAKGALTVRREQREECAAQERAALRRRWQ